MQPQVLEVTFAHVESALNSENVGRIKDQLSRLLKRSGNVVLDLRDAKLDSAGLGAVLSMQRQLELQERRLFVVATDPEFHALLELAGVPGSLSLFTDADQAVACARAPGCGMAA